MFTQKELLKIVSKLHYNYGSFKVFIKISTNLGIKLCDSEILRDNNYDRQERASLVGLGPEVYGKFDITIDNVVLYGYYTEVVKVFDHYGDFSKEFSQYDLYELQRKLKHSIGFHCHDVGYYNIGVKNGSMVLVDFDSSDCWESNAINIMSLINKL